MVFQRIFGRKVGKSGFGSSTTAEQVVAGTDLTGKVAVVTGESSFVWMSRLTFASLLLSP